MRSLSGPSHRAGGDRGSTAIELVLLAPPLMFAIFVLIQAALYMHARQVALAGAQQGARLVRTGPAGTASLERARAATLDYLHQLGGDVLTDPTIRISRTEASATVEVTGRAVSIVPGVTLTIRAHSAGPTENFRRP